MNFKINLLFFLILPFVKCDVDFIDCGSNELFVDEVDIPGCSKTPCRFSRGSNYDVYIIPDHLDPQVDSIQLESYVTLWGALFPVYATCAKPCVTDCPLRHYLKRPRLDFNIGFPQTLQRVPGCKLVLSPNPGTWNETVLSITNLSVVKRK